MSFCLNGLIATTAECEVTDSQVLSVTDLPYLSLKTGSKIIDEFDCSVDTMINNLLDQAAKYVINDFKTRASNLFKTGKVIKREDYTRFNQCKEEIPLDNKFKGYLIKNTSESRSNILIERFVLFGNGETTLKVYNAIDGTELHSQTIIATNKIETFSVNKSFDAEMVLIGFIQNIDVRPPSNSVEMCGCNTFTTLTPILINDLDYRECNVENSSAIFGLSYSIQCNIDSYICEIRERFAFPILFKFGILLHQKAAVSPRINEVVKFLSEESIGEYYESLYLNAMDTLVANYNPPCDDCFEPNSRVKFIATLP